MCWFTVFSNERRLLDLITPSSLPSIRMPLPSAAHRRKICCPTERNLLHGGAESVALQNEICWAADFHVSFAKPQAEAASYKTVFFHCIAADYQCVL